MPLDFATSPVKDTTNPTSISLGGPFLLVLTNLLLLWMVIIGFNVEVNLGLFKLMPVVFTGFLIHSFLPIIYRPPFFLLLTLGSILMFLGPVAGMTTIVFAFILIGLCHLPIPLLFRKLLVLAIAILLIFFRAEVLPFFTSSNALVVLASLFMFRMFVYLFEVKHQKEPVNIFHRLNYFFLLPNIIFPIFPIIDFKLFYRQYYNQVPITLYQEGVKRMLRGVLHLLAYRVLYLYCVPALPEITDIYTLLAYVVFSYMLILRLSGLFHLVIGITFLFGYNLPEIFDNYFLANGFDDYWRRINIYWRDFMVKIFYYPIYFRVKKWGMNTAIVVSTLIIFIFNWFLHAYQWFWIIGEYSIRLTDVLFWSIFGLLVTGNIMVQLKKKKTKRKKEKNGFYYLHESGKVMATFIIIALLWSLWTSPSVPDWGRLMVVGVSAPLIDWIIVLLGLGLTLLLLTGFLRFQDRYSTPLNLWFNKWNPQYALSVLVILSSLNYFSTQIDDNISGSISINNFKQNKLNTTDEEQLFTGYYDEVLASKTLSSGLWDLNLAEEVTVKNKNLEEENPEESNLSSIIKFTKVDNILERQFIPNIKYELKGAIVKINQWGLRGENNYEKEKTQGVTRLALMGGSVEFGSGVANDENLSYFLANNFNKNKFDGNSQFEVINFARPGMSTFQNLFLLENKVVDFSPQYVLYPIHAQSLNRLSTFLFKSFDEDKEGYFRDTWMYEFLESTNIQSTDLKWEIKKKLKANESEYFSLFYQNLARIAKENNIQLICFSLPQPVPLKLRVASKKIESQLVEIEKNNIPYLDLLSVFEDVDDYSSIRIKPNDLHHPNALGFELIAKELYQQLRILLENESSISK